MPGISPVSKSKSVSVNDADEAYITLDVVLGPPG